MRISVIDVDSNINDEHKSFEQLYFHPYCNNSFMLDDTSIQIKKIRKNHFVRTGEAVVWDLANAACHPVVEERPIERRSERPDIRALGRSGGTDLFDVTICHPISQVRIRDVVETTLSLLKVARSAKVSKYAGTPQAAGTGFNLLPTPSSTLGGWYPEAHRALGAVATTIAARGRISKLFT